MREQRQSELTGKAGEYAVASQLLLRGIIAYWPAVDRGCDLLTDNGVRIQVKSAHLSPNGGNPLYFFPLPKLRKTAQAKDKVRIVQRKSFVETCDYVVFWGIEQNRFWVVPAYLCDACTGVELGRVLETGPRFVGSITDMREMIALGYTRGKVAKHYGITRTSLQQFLDSGRDAVDESVVSQIRSCEGRWDSISDFRGLAPVTVDDPMHLTKLEEE